MDIEVLITCIRSCSLSSVVGGPMQFHSRCKRLRSIDQNIGTFVCRPRSTVLRNPILDVRIR